MTAKEGSPGILNAFLGVTSLRQVSFEQPNLNDCQKELKVCCSTKKAE